MKPGAADRLRALGAGWPAGRRAAQAARAGRVSAGLRAVAAVVRARGRAVVVMDAGTLAKRPHASDRDQALSDINRGRRPRRR